MKKKSAKSERNWWWTGLAHFHQGCRMTVTCEICWNLCKTNMFSHNWRRFVGEDISAALQFFFKMPFYHTFYIKVWYFVLKKTFVLDVYSPTGALVWFQPIPGKSGKDLTMTWSVIINNKCACNTIVHSWILLRSLNCECWKINMFMRL